MSVSLRPDPFDPWAELAIFTRSHSGLGARAGAAAVFVGSMRDINQGTAVSAMTLEHYPAMTQKYLEDLRRDALTRWKLLELLVIHRYGEIAPGDPIVLVAAWSAHRQAAFDACRGVMEALKARAPFWKRELTPDGARWVKAESEHGE